jgi:hypothetical protein
MAQIKGWHKLRDEENPLRGSEAWMHLRTKTLLLVDRVVGGGGVVYIKTPGNDYVNALSPGQGFRTKALANKWASNYRRKNP